MGPFKPSSNHNDKSTGVFIVQVLFKQLCSWKLLSLTSHSYIEDKCHSGHSGPLALRMFLSHLLWGSLNLRCRDCVLHASLTAKHPHSLCIWPVRALYIGLVQKEASLMRGKSYSYLWAKGEYLEWGSKLYWFRKMAVVYTPQRSMTILFAGTWLGFQYHTWFLSSWVGLGYSQDLSATIVPLAISCYDCYVVVHRHHSW